MRIAGTRYHDHLGLRALRQHGFELRDPALRGPIRWQHQVKQHHGIRPLGHGGGARRTVISLIDAVPLPPEQPGVHRAKRRVIINHQDGGFFGRRHALPSFDKRLRFGVKDQHPLIRIIELAKECTAIIPHRGFSRALTAIRKPYAVRH